LTDKLASVSSLRDRGRAVGKTMTLAECKYSVSKVVIFLMSAGMEIRIFSEISNDFRISIKMFLTHLQRGKFADFWDKQLETVAA
jgi:hypothetical protein